MAPGTPDAPLVIEFGESLDRALTERLLAVEDAAGAAVDGHVQLSAGETRWSFSPERPWRPGDYRLRISPSLEDLAGNTLERRFEEAIGAATRVAAPVTGIPFHVPTSR